MVVVGVDAFSNGRMRRGLTMVNDVNFEAVNEAVEMKNDAGDYQGPLSLCCATVRLTKP